MKITRQEMENCCEHVCILLKRIHSHKRGEASREEWSEMWAVLSYWREACNQQKRTTSRNLSNKLAWNVCIALSNYDCGGGKVTRQKCWKKIWFVFHLWDTGDYSNEDRKRRFMLQKIEQKRMDKEFRERIL